MANGKQTLAVRAAQTVGAAAERAVKLRPTRRANEIAKNALRVTVYKAVSNHGADWWRQYKDYLKRHAVAIAKTSEALAKLDRSRRIRSNHVCEATQFVILRARRDCRARGFDLLEGCAGYRGPRSIGCRPR